MHFPVFHATISAGAKLQLRQQRLTRALRERGATVPGEASVSFHLVPKIAAEPRSAAKSSLSRRE